MKFTESHEWADVKEGIATVGITRYAQRELGEIVYVELPQVGKRVDAGQEMAVLESTKAAADIYTPVSGEIIAVSGEALRYINADAEGKGWLFKVRLEKPEELEGLLTQEQYLAMVQ